MKRLFCILFLLFPGNLFFGQLAMSGVVSHQEKKESDYEMHLRIVVQNFASRIQRPKQSQLNLFQNNSSLSLKTDPILKADNLTYAGQEEFTKFSINDNGLQDISASPVMTGNNIVLTREQQGDFIEGSVGSFLDSVKDDPSLRTIYFTSKDLTFNFRKNIANFMQDSFQDDPNNPDMMNRPWENPDFEDRPLTEQEKKIIKAETSLLFGLISDSFKNILLVLAILSGALYLSFRYILNKYI